MAFIPAQNTVRASLIWEASSEFYAMNTLYFKCNVGVPTPTLITALHTDIVVPWLTDAVAGGFWNQTVKTTFVNYRDLTVEDSYVLDLSVSVDNSGENTSPLLPSSVAQVVTFLTGRAGQAFQGRNFVAGWGENQVVNNSFTGGIANNSSAWYDLLAEMDDGTDWTWVVASFVEDGLPRLTAETTPVINTINRVAKVRSQRRRLKHIA